MCLASPPTLSTIAHAACSVVGSALVGCPPAGTNTLTLSGGNLYGSPLTVSFGCTGAITQYPTAFNQLTCTLAAGGAGTTTGNVVVTTNDGDTSATTGLTIGYGKC